MAQAKSEKHDKKSNMRRGMVRLLAWYLGLMAIMLIFLLTHLWPDEFLKKPDFAGDNAVKIWGWEFDLSYETTVLLLVIIVGALGSYIHAATSLVSYLGNDRLKATWFWWYMLRPCLGMALATIIYFVIRGGLMPSGISAENTNLFGILAIAGMAGIFSKQATDKLREVFDTLFGVASDDGRADKLENPKPVIVNVSPDKFVVGAENQTLSIEGSGFIEESIALVNDEERETDYIAESELSLTLLDTDIANVGKISIQISNPAPGGGKSATITIGVVADDGDG